MNILAYLVFVNWVPGSPKYLLSHFMFLCYYCLYTYCCRLLVLALLPLLGLLRRAPDA